MLLVVDTGVDDALALALAVRHPGVRLEAVFTSFGNVDLEHVNDNTLRVLDWLGAGETPVYSGAPTPLTGPPLDARHWHGSDGLGGARLLATRRTVLPDAVSELCLRLAASPGALTLVCTGPLTNLALALRRAPELVGQVRNVVVMGGAVELPGNTTPVAEYNTYADPEAAALVYAQTGWHLTMVGLNVTRRTTLTAAEIARVATDDSHPAVLLREVTRDLFAVRQVESISLHDPLAVGVAVDPSLVQTRAGRVQVETRGEFTRGQTIFDLRRSAVEKLSRADPGAGRSASTRAEHDRITHVAIDVDAARFQRLFLETLGLCVS
jgi:inosine-uridine nucleoside N-ribohydrolase